MGDVFQRLGGANLQEIPAAQNEERYEVGLEGWDPIRPLAPRVRAKRKWKLYRACPTRYSVPDGRAGRGAAFSLHSDSFDPNSKGLAVHACKHQLNHR